MPIVRKCRVSPTISAMAIPGCPTACCWPPMPPVGCWPASCSKAGDCCHRGPHRDRARDAVVRRAGDLLAGDKLSARARFLFAAGFLELSFNAMAQSLVQLDAPPDKRGRVIGLFNMSSLGLRAFSGISVGLLGSLIGVHWSLALSALATMAIAGWAAGAAVAMATDSSDSAQPTGNAASFSGGFPTSVQTRLSGNARLPLPALPLSHCSARMRMWSFIPSVVNRARTKECERRGQVGAACSGPKSRKNSRQDGIPYGSCAIPGEYDKDCLPNVIFLTFRPSRIGLICVARRKKKVTKTAATGRSIQFEQSLQSGNKGLLRPYASQCGSVR